MEMHTEKDRTAEILGELNTHLFDIGLLETVDNYLNSQPAYAVVDEAFAAWIKTLRDFVAKMPEIAHEESGKTIDTIESTKESCRKAVYVGFKQNLSAALEVLAGYVGIESTVKEIIANEAQEEMWGKKLAAICQVLLEEADVKAKTDIMVAAIEVTESEEDQMALSNVLAEDPNANEILMSIEKKMRVHDVASMLATAVVSELFGIDLDDEDEDDE